MNVVAPESVSDYVGKEVGVSDWLLIDQERINQFADVTEDHQFIHVDPDAAKASPFGTTVAHGFLTLSMLSKLASGCVLILEGVKMGVNYGFERVRFSNPVKVDKRIRAHFTLMSATQKVSGQWSLKYAVKVEIEDEAKPALVAEWVTMQFV
ncbi:MAG: MaoC family dehydratase [Pseudomonadota bacterium]